MGKKRKSGSSTVIVELEKANNSSPSNSGKSEISEKPEHFLGEEVAGYESDDSFPGHLSAPTDRYVLDPDPDMEYPPGYFDLESYDYSEDELGTQFESSKFPEGRKFFTITPESEVDEPSGGSLDQSRFTKGRASITRDHKGIPFSEPINPKSLGKGLNLGSACKGCSVLKQVRRNRVKLSRYKSSKSDCKNPPGVNQRYLIIKSIITRAKSSMEYMISLKECLLGSIFETTSWSDHTGKYSYYFGNGIFQISRTPSSKVAIECIKSAAFVPSSLTMSDLVRIRDLDLTRITSQRFLTIPSHN